MRRARAHQAGRKLVQIGLADKDGAGRAQTAHDGRVFLRRVGKRGTRRGGGPARRIDVVLDGKRHAIQRQARDVAARRGQQETQAVELFIELDAVHAPDPGVVLVCVIAGLGGVAGQQRLGLRPAAIGGLPLRDGPTGGLLLRCCGIHAGILSCIQVRIPKQSACHVGGARRFPSDARPDRTQAAGAGPRIGPFAAPGSGASRTAFVQTAPF